MSLESETVDRLAGIEFSTSRRRARLDPKWSILNTIGDTPLAQLQHLPIPGAGRVFAKCEQMNPGGSVKDRIAKAMVEKAEAEGLLTNRSTLVEPTSGNTGIGLAMVAAVKGYDAF